VHVCVCGYFRVIDIYKIKTSSECHVTQHRSADEYSYKNMTNCSNYKPCLNAGCVRSAVLNTWWHWHPKCLIVVFWEHGFLRPCGLWRPLLYSSATAKWNPLQLLFTRCCIIASPFIHHVITITFIRVNGGRSFWHWNISIVFQLFFYFSLLINYIKNVLIHFVKKLLLFLNVVLSCLPLFLNALLKINL